MKILLTGFEPFLNYTENSSWMTAEQVATRGVVGCEVIVEQMPVSFTRVSTALRKAVEKHRPDAIVMLGQSGVSESVRLERVALNMMDATNADNDSFSPNEQPISADAPSALFTAMPIKSLRAAIDAAGVKVKISNSAGLYVCNRLYYEALTMCNEQPSMRAIFVHLPFYEGQPSATINKPTMPLDSMVKAIQTIIEEIKND